MEYTLNGREILQISLLLRRDHMGSLSSIKDIKTIFNPIQSFPSTFKTLLTIVCGILNFLVHFHTNTFELPKNLIHNDLHSFPAMLK